VKCQGSIDFFRLSDEVIKDVVYKTGFKSFLPKKFLTQFKSGIAMYDLYLLDSSSTSPNHILVELFENWNFHTEIGSNLNIVGKKTDF